ncbi:MAG: hypothetical protein MSG78_01710 [Clostridiales bacterium]|nr:hypothetical protein [Clostridiales bacterium]
MPMDKKKIFLFFFVLLLLTVLIIYVLLRRRKLMVSTVDNHTATKPENHQMNSTHTNFVSSPSVAATSNMEANNIAATTDEHSNNTNTEIDIESAAADDTNKLVDDIQTNETINDMQTEKPAAQVQSAEAADDTSKASVFFWTPNGKSYHADQNCSSLRRSKTILSGSETDAAAAGKTTLCSMCSK